MTLLINSATTGLERIQREAFLILFDNLNDAIAEAEAQWVDLDSDFWAHTGRTPRAITVELVDPANFHYGHRPSLIKAPISEYPNCSVIGDRVGPSANDVLDQLTVRENRLAVEVMAKSDVDEDEVTRRIQRMADAANAVLIANTTLNGVVQEIVGPLRVFITDLQVRKERTSHGKPWFWQGARLEYGVQKESAIPGPSGGFLRSAGIDQH